MKTRAAVLRESPGKFEVVDIDLEEPRQDELRVKLVAAGLCHSDDHLQTGDLVGDHYPIIGGHEGAGIVEAVGPNTSGWEVGDHVVFSFLPACGHCRWCAEGISNLCNVGQYTVRGSRFDDPDSFRFSLDGQPVGQIAGLGTFAERTVVSALSAVKVAKELPLDKVVLLGCGVGTGWGSAVYSAEIMPGDVVIVMGIGGIGINAVQGAAHAGAGTIIAVDPVPLKLDKALELGATHAFADIGEAADFARTVTDGQGADKAIVTVGITAGEHIAQAFDAIRKAGTVVVTGIGDMSGKGGIPINPWMLTMMQKRIQGSLFGSSNPFADIPRQIRMYQNGQLKLDELITQTYTLDDIATGYEDMHAGKNIRGVILFD
ncbi:S-(hydroxymethyl)glutathione dehydrogenase/class III alcohol dehydrogenase [Rhodococcus opacus PD630]|uniref:NDMA-dependent alcohol dehydrogenase n=1 Tax=Rhodococcus opacus TaxID=37919 RepID=UPI00029CB77C|nr:NDMA-dependent alcohol dehydrogenase [Rhodococcus opacus]EHI43667.1 S-(hydroxymethyl)glutathione dehydrogenase/class III alcohol dehydrogenase [Rhodococcus opacus PD630]UDH01212.1 NDMA-dependent alcohol dehydrogenase [Rhodococcus opacus PD630]